MWVRSPLGTKFWCRLCADQKQLNEDQHTNPDDMFQDLQGEIDTLRDQKHSSEADAKESEAEAL